MRLVQRSIRDRGYFLERMWNFVWCCAGRRFSPCRTGVESWHLNHPPWIQIYIKPEGFKFHEEHRNLTNVFAYQSIEYNTKFEKTYVFNDPEIMLSVVSNIHETFAHELQIKIEFMLRRVRASLNNLMFRTPVDGRAHSLSMCTSKLSLPWVKGFHWIRFKIALSHQKSVYRKQFSRCKSVKFSRSMHSVWQRVNEAKNISQMKL